MCAVLFGSFRIDEHGKTRGGADGDQSHKEGYIQKGYKKGADGRVVIRAKNPALSPFIADAMRSACLNDLIGYNQSRRLELYHDSEQYGFNPAMVKTPSAADCSSAVRVCILYALRKMGLKNDIPNFRTISEPQMLKATGLFELLYDAKYTDSLDYLRNGDIICTTVSGHTLVVLGDGKYANKPPQPADNTIKPTTYKVMPRDNLTKIARKFNTTVAALVKLNGITNANVIRAGKVIKIK
jgi:hypothetical protein